MANPKATLLKLNQNLNILQEREAKYAGNAPLEILNQISDHRQAIDLTRQAIIGELDEAEWQEALKPLLLACQNGQVVNIEAETYIAGDQIITHIYEAPPPRPPPAEAKARRELGILLGKVKQFWIEGVLEKSVYNVALIDLGKETQAEAVAHAWEQILELPNQERQTLPPDKKIGQIFEEMNRALLILGAPGSGKTITLLQLLRDLITQAEQDPNLAQPVPVVFNLSTWTEGQPLIEWLVTELSAKYQIPKRIGRSWLENYRLLPLLDGLDEVKPEERAACVTAINHFGTEFGLSGLAVCSRLQEYTNLPARLKLNGAIRLQPLTLEQVYDYLEIAGEKLNVLRTVLEVDDGLQSLARSPLTLGIMTLAYQDIPAESLIGQAQQSLEARRQHLFDTYLERMFGRRGVNRPFDDRWTKDWLSWLAQEMRQHNQTMFLIEHLQPSWLLTQTQLWLYTFISRLIVGLGIGLGSALIIETVDGLSNRLTAGLSVEQLISDWISGLIGGILFGLISGALVGLVDMFRFKRSDKAVKHKTRFSVWQPAVVVLLIGVSVGLIYGWITSLLTDGLFFGLSFGLIVGVRGNQRRPTNDIQPTEALKWSWGRALKGCLLGLMGGLTMGLIGGYIDGAKDDTLFGLPFNLIVELGVGLSYGLIFALIGAILGGLHSQIVETKVGPNQGIRLSIQNALFAGLIFGLCIGLFFGLMSALSNSFLLGRNDGLLFGVILGWGAVVSIGLLAALWYGGLDTIQHFTLRLIMWYEGYTPYNYIHFLDYAAQLIFIQKVGGGYIFIHRLLLEHFAAMNKTGLEVNIPATGKPDSRAH